MWCNGVPNGRSATSSSFYAAHSSLSCLNPRTRMRAALVCRLLGISCLPERALNEPRRRCQSVCAPLPPCIPRTTPLIGPVCSSLLITLPSPELARLFLKAPFSHVVPPSTSRTNEQVICAFLQTTSAHVRAAPRLHIFLSSRLRAGRLYIYIVVYRVELSPAAQPCPPIDLSTVHPIQNHHR